MSKLFTLAAMATVLFGVSAAASTMLQPTEDSPETDESEKNELVERDSKKVVAADLADKTFQPQGVTAETVLRLSDSIRKREVELIARETAVGQREEQVRFLLEDLKRERQEIGAMLELAEKRAAQSRAMLEESKSNSEENESGDQEGSEPNKRSPDSGNDTPNDSENLEIIASWVQSMPPEQAAESIRTMCNDGKMDTVIRVFGFLEQRNTAKILGALEDPSLVAELLERFRLSQSNR